MRRNGSLTGICFWHKLDLRGDADSGGPALTAAPGCEQRTWLQNMELLPLPHPQVRKGTVIEVTLYHTDVTVSVAGVAMVEGSGE